MALTLTDRQRVAHHYMRVLPQYLTGPDAVFAGLLKADIVQFMVDTDTWVEGNQGATSTGVGYNAALSLPARTALTTAQKSLGFCFVVMRRQGLLPTAEG